MGEPEVVVITDILDLTNSHFSDQDFLDVPLPHSLTQFAFTTLRQPHQNVPLQSIDLTANRLTRLDERLQTLPALRSLSFRQNLLHSAGDISKLASTSGVLNLAAHAVLEHLILHDNQLQELPPLGRLSALVHLEASYNEIRSVSAVAELPCGNLEELYLASNKISIIEGVTAFTTLRILELGSNRIRELSGIENLEQLEELWLGRNRIATIQGLGRLSRLKKLSIQSNRLTRIEGLEGCVHLKELYLSHNGIQTIQGLESLSELEVLDLSNNRIKQVERISSHAKLKDLWLNDNAIANIEELCQSLAALKASLSCLYIGGNPAVKGNNHRTILRDLLPSLDQLDADSLEH